MMNENNLDITEISGSDKSLVSKFISESWGSVLSVSRSKVYDASTLPGFICKKKNKIIGLLTYNIKDNECEIVTLDSKISNKGLGTKLLNLVIEKAKVNQCERIWLITTNDNTNAIRFYQKRGFEWTGFYKDAMKESRKIKPEIPELGNDNIPIKHEIEFEYKLKQEI